MADDVQPNASGNVLQNTRVKSNSTSLGSKDVDKVLRSSPMGQITTAIGDSFRGFNHRQAPSLIQINKDYYGMTFFTRPRLNLSTGNLRTLRALTPLLTNEEKSIQRIIRCYLDPVGNKAGQFTSPFVDSNSAFIPLLSNMLISLPGWPDMVMPHSTSQEGVMKEQFNLADGTVKIYRSVELNANFRNIQGDPISSLFAYWLQYMEGVYMGDIVPYPDAIYENEVDYQTRIYRLILDSTKRYVLRIAATGVSSPSGSPIGAAFNYEANGDLGPINDGLQQVSVPFQNSGILYNDDILMYEFNRAGELFNPSLAEIVSDKTDKNGKSTRSNSQRSSVYQKIAIDELPLFNHRGYPRIDLNTGELEWWVRKDDYLKILPLVKQRNTELGRI